MATIVFSGHMYRNLSADRRKVHRVKKQNMKYWSVNRLRNVHDVASVLEQKTERHQYIVTSAARLHAKSMRKLFVRNVLDSKTTSARNRKDNIWN